MLCKAKIMSNVKKCINESKSSNTNINFNVNQLNQLFSFRGKNTIAWEILCVTTYPGLRPLTGFEPTSKRFD